MEQPPNAVCIQFTNGYKNYRICPIRIEIIRITIYVMVVVYLYL
jgi:hypothetical protein